MSRIDGVIETQVGYANGLTENPDYHQVCSGLTGHAEVCLVRFDEGRVSLDVLLHKYWDIIDPTLQDRQGPDIGSQYRTGIYYTDDHDLPVIERSREAVQIKYRQPVVTEIGPLTSYYEAEEYHQKYLKKNPNGYCHIDLS